MPRKRYIATSDYLYHIWARSSNREWFGLHMDETWNIFSNHLYLLKHGFDVQIYSFVLMSNHYHMLLKTPQCNLAKSMNYFQREVSREIGRRTSRINQIFGGPYGSSIILTNSYYLNAYKYIYRNPIEANIISRAEKYPFSTLHGLLGQKPLLIPVEEDQTLFSDVEGTLAWINRAYPSEEIKNALKNAMRKNEFKFAKKFNKDEVF